MSTPESPDVEPPKVEPKVVTYELNEDGQYVDVETGELAPTVEPLAPESDLMPQWLIDQHYGDIPVVLPGGPIPEPPPAP